MSIVVKPGKLVPMKLISQYVTKMRQQQINPSRVMRGLEMRHHVLFSYDKIYIQKIMDHFRHTTILNRNRHTHILFHHNHTVAFIQYNR